MDARTQAAVEEFRIVLPGMQLGGGTVPEYGHGHAGR